MTFPKNKNLQKAEDTRWHEIQSATASGPILKNPCSPPPACNVDDKGGPSRQMMSSGCICICICDDCNNIRRNRGKEEATIHNHACNVWSSVGKVLAAEAISDLF